MQVLLTCSDGIVACDTTEQLHLLVEQCRFFSALLGGEPSDEVDDVVFDLPPGSTCSVTKAFLELLHLYSSRGGGSVERDDIDEFLERVVLLHEGMANDDRLVSLLVIADVLGHERLVWDIGHYLHRKVCCEANEEATFFHSADRPTRAIGLSERLDLIGLLNDVVAADRGGGTD